MKAVERIAIIVAGAGAGRLLLPAIVPAWLGVAALILGGAVAYYAYRKSGS